ncbi:MAG: hypothetical protein H7840_10650 [Alphaproteobacteria bacterium]
MLKTALVFLGLLVMASCAHQGHAPMHRAILTAFAAQRDGDEDRAFAAFREAAGLGHPFALSEVGRSFLDGNGIKRDVDQAIAYFRLVAENHAGTPYGPRASWRLACLYFRGTEGLVPDLEAAAHWMALAARTKRKAALALSSFYRLGIGLPEDLSPAEYRALADHWLDIAVHGSFPSDSQEELRLHGDHLEANAASVLEHAGCFPPDPETAGILYLMSWKNGYSLGLRNYCSIQNRYFRRKPAECSMS